MKNDTIAKVKKFLAIPENRLEALEYCYDNLHKHTFICHALNTFCNAKLNIRLDAHDISFSGLYEEVEDLKLHILIPELEHPAKFKYTKEQKNILVIDPTHSNSWGSMLNVYYFGKNNKDYLEARKIHLNNAIDKLKNNGKND